MYKAELDDCGYLLSAVWQDDSTRRGFLQRVRIRCICMTLRIACSQAIIRDDKAKLLEKSRV
jgi:hypothetical protein